MSKIDRAKIIIVETTPTDTVHIAKAIDSLGFEPVFFCNMDLYHGEARSQILGTHHYDVNTKDISCLIESISLNKLTKIVGVFCCSEKYLGIASQLTQKLLVDGIDPAINILNDKGSVAKIVPEYSPPSIIFSSNDIPYSHLKKMFLSYGGLIVKPTHSAGSVGMFMIHDEKGVADIDDYLDKNNVLQLRHLNWIAQPILQGMLVSLEGFKKKDELHALGYTKRTKINHTESVSEHLIDEQISQAQKDKSILIIRTLLQRAEFQYGYFHSELIFTANDDCYLIDANIGRIAGAGIAQQIALSHGKNPSEIYAHVVDVGIFKGQFVNTDDVYIKNPKKTLSINYGIRTNATLLDLKLPNNYSCWHTRLKDFGKIIPPMGLDNRSFVGIAVGFPGALQREVDQIKIHTDVGIESPYY